MEKGKTNKLTTDQNADIRKETKIIIAVGFLILLSVMFFLITEIRALNTKMNSLNDSINGNLNNKHFSNVVDIMHESVFMVAVPIPSGYNPSLVDAIYTDNAGRNWKIGTGFVIKSDGNSSYLLTAFHVVNGSTVMSIISRDSKEIKATLYSGNPDLDLAVIKVETKLKPVIIGKLEDIKVGSKIAFTGYPLNDPVAQITHEGDNIIYRCL